MEFTKMAVRCYTWNICVFLVGVPKPSQIADEDEALRAGRPALSLQPIRFF